MPYLILFDDEMGLCCPMTWDKETPGAVEGAGSSDPIAVFHERNDALRAIRVSRKKAESAKERGDEIPNDDFLGEARKCIKVRRIEFPLDLPWRNSKA